MTDNELAKIRKHFADGRTADICLECKSECFDTSMHPRSDGTWNTRCAYCLDQAHAVKVFDRVGCEMVEDLADEVARLQAQAEHLQARLEAAQRQNERLAAENDWLRGYKGAPSAANLDQF